MLIQILIAWEYIFMFFPKAKRDHQQKSTFESRDTAYITLHNNQR